MKKVLHILFVITFILCIDNINAYTEYKIGDEITYNDIKFYVIKDSSSDESSITMLKAEPLSTEEVNFYGGVGTKDNHVNKYTSSSQGTAYDINGYGGMAYYSSPTCGDVNSNWIDLECNTEYNDSDIKFVVDAWANDNISNGLSEVRLITFNEFISIRSNNWSYSDQYWYWTMTATDKNTISVYPVTQHGLDWSYGTIIGYSFVVRPVVIIKKTALGDIDEIIDVKIDNKDSENTKTDINEIIDKKDNNTENINVFINKKEVKTSVNVPNTLQKVSIVFILIGIVLVSISTIILIKNRNIIKK